MTPEPSTIPQVPRGFHGFKELARTLRRDRARANRERPADKPRRYHKSIWPRLTRPIFVIGAPRSGTTFLGSCMHALPEVSFHHEPVATKIATSQVYLGWRGPAAERYFRRTYRWLLRFAGEGDLRLCDKTPRNSLIVPFLSQAFPDSVFIHIYRDGRDSALSHRDMGWLNADQAGKGFEPGGNPLGPSPQVWVEPDRAEEYRNTSDLHRCIWAWRRYTEEALKQGRSLPSDRYCEIKYENLVDDLPSQANTILDTIGIEREDSRRRFMEALSGFHGRSVERWRREMTQDELFLCESDSGELLQKLGYPLAGSLEQTSEMTERSNG